jgi:hypothetical protein
MSDKESDEAPSKDESTEDNTTKRLRKAKKVEEHKNNRAEKASNIHMEEMRCMLVHVEQGMEKCIIERLAEQTRKHDEDPKALKKSQAASNIMFTNNNPTRIISYKAA